jgi:hypothetical protein
MRLGRLPQESPRPIGEEQTVNVTIRWARRLLTSVRVQPVGQPSESTLETFFAGVRWSEDLQPGGRRTLRRTAM